MRVWTVRAEKGKLVGGFCLLAALFLLGVCVFSLDDAVTAGKVTGDKLAAAIEADRQAIFASFGWEVSETPVEIMETEVPTAFKGENADFLAMQETCEFPLAEAAGKRVTAYTYAVHSHPTGREDVQATLWVHEGRAVAGFLQLGEITHAMDWQGEAMQAPQKAEDAAGGVAEYPTD